MTLFVMFCVFLSVQYVKQMSDICPSCDLGLTIDNWDIDLVEEVPLSLQRERGVIFMYIVVLN